MTVHYMPSEIARLVLGYLKQTDCNESAKHMISESIHLTEYANGLKHGITYSTSIGGKSLVDVINSQQNSPLNSNKTTIDTNQSDCIVKQEVEAISKQLTSLESSLSQLSQIVVKSIETNRYNNQILSSPSLISNSSPLYLNNIGYNSTPFLVNDQNLLNVLPNNRNEEQTQFKTPSKSAISSPRRKSLPRRRFTSGSTPSKVNFNCDQSSELRDSSEFSMTSDPLRDESESQLRIDINEPLVQPGMIVGELINFEPLHEALAENINKIFNISNSSDECSDNITVIQQKRSPVKSCIKKNNHVIAANERSDLQEIQISDDLVNDIIANLETAPEYNTLLDIITEKELQMTPYKNIFSNESTSSASSLNTPQTPQLRLNSNNVNNVSVVKNLMPDLRSPEKTVTLYAAQQSPIKNMVSMSSINVTPVKLIRTNLTPCKTIIMNDFGITGPTNNTLILPKISIPNDNCAYNASYNTNVATVSNNSCNYTIRVEKNSGPKVRDIYKNKGKRVDLSKLSELQKTKRSDSMQRRILPKVSNSSTNSISSVCVSNNEIIVPNQSTIIVESPDRPNSVVNNKRSNSSTNQSPNKLRASESRFPNVNILRNMNVSKFLEQIHSNQ